MCVTCLGACCGQMACECCQKISRKRTNSRVPYLIIMACGLILALCLRYWGKPWIIHLYFWSYNACGDSSRCVGFGAAYRISFLMFSMFAVIALGCLAKSSAPLFHHGLWLLKIIYLIGFFFLYMTVVPNDFFDVYSMISRFVSGIFLLLQIIILIDFAYGLNEKISHDMEKPWLSLIISIICYGLAITIGVFCFTTWFDNGDCKRNEFFIGFTFAITFIASLLSISGINDKGNLLTSALVTLYAFFLLWSALQSDPSTCNQLNSNDTPQLIIGIFIAVVSVTYAGHQLASQTLFGDMAAKEEAEPKADVEAAAVRPKIGDDGDADDADAKDEKAGDITEMDEDQRAATFKFHVVMAITSMYIAMIITDWGSETASSGVNYNLGTVTVYIKMVSQWVTMLLYIWSIIAPKILSGRDFS